VESYPDSALLLLDSITAPYDLKEEEYNKYLLLQIQAKDKLYRDITGDTLIFQVRDYYVQKNDMENAALAAFYCGRIWHERKNTDKAATAYLQANELANKTKNNNLKGVIYGNIGILYREHSLYKESIASSKDAVEMYDKAKNYRNKISALKLIGDCFLLMEQIDSAFHYYNESLELADLYNIPELQSNTRHNIGVAYRQKGYYYYNDAKRFLGEALSYSTDSVSQARILLNIAQVYILEDKNDSVKLYLDKALALNVQDIRLKRSTYLLRANMEEKEKKYADALKSYKEYYYSTMEVFDSEKNNKLQELQKKYDFEKIENTNNKLIISKQQILLLLALALLGLVTVAFIFYWKSVKNKALMTDLEQKIDGLQKMADNFSGKKQTFRNILLDHLNIIRKMASLKVEFKKEDLDTDEMHLKKFNKIVYGQDTLDWEKLYQVMNNLREGFHDRIREKYPQFNELEFRILCLTCEKFDDTEIAIILDKTIPMVRKIRNKIRESLKMPKYTHDFLPFLEENCSTME
jgi:tetratricopeptide (TPR) repeat protein